MPDKDLIIDDDTDTLRAVGLMLPHQGYSISTACPGAHGNARAVAQRIPNMADSRLHASGPAQ